MYHKEDVTYNLDSLIYIKHMNNACDQKLQMIKLYSHYREYIYT